ncbi:MAG: YcbK family protein [Gammaproteobacteria bacterium]
MKFTRNRRRLLQAAGLLLPLAFVPVTGFARLRSERRLKFSHTHTSESLSILYCEDGQYVPEALIEINHLLRDFRTGDVHAIDPRLLDILHAVQIRAESRGRFEVISGYRSQTTNAMLRRHSSSVSQGSLHLKGRAIDVRLSDVPTRLIRKAAISLAHGGVGYYPASDFVHLDTGRFRTW